MYKSLHTINTPPRPWEFYTAETLWTDPHIAQQMLSFHLNETVDAASRNHTFIANSIAWMTERFFIGDGTTIADFGCGPGLYTLPLARTGASVTGIDFSSNSLDYAHKKASETGLYVDYLHANYLEYQTDKRFDLVIMIMCDFCALSPLQQNTMLTTFRNIVKPGGFLMLDVFTPMWYRQQQESAIYEHNHMNGFWSPRDYYAFANVFLYEEEQLVLQKYTIIETERIRTVYNWLQAFSRESLERKLKENGLVIDEWYADVGGSPYDASATEMAIIARPK